MKVTVLAYRKAMQARGKGREAAMGCQWADRKGKA
jgi:hypothetical protein